MKKNILIVVFNLIFTPFLVTNQLHAEEMAAGLGLGLFHIPEEKDFEKESMPLEFFSIWMWTIGGSSSGWALIHLKQKAATPH